MVDGDGARTGAAGLAPLLPLKSYACPVLTDQPNRLRFADMWRALVLLMLPLVLACHRRVPPVEINLLWQRDYLNITPADVNGDSTDEFVSITDDYVLNRISSDMRAAARPSGRIAGHSPPTALLGSRRKPASGTHTSGTTLCSYSAR